jgi:hypothetical protein
MSGVLTAGVGISPPEGVDAFAFSITISSNTADYNLYSALVGLGWDETKPVSGTVTLATGNTVYSTSTSTAAFRQGGAFPDGSSASIVIESGAVIAGKGGAGGQGAPINSYIFGNGFPGLTGGPGLAVNSSITVNNLGTIAGGGGGGSGGGGALAWNGDIKSPTYHAGSGGAGGGGGAGSSLSAAVAGAAGVSSVGTAKTDGGAGSNGSDTGGAGGTRATEAADGTRKARGGGAGGAGGARGSSGAVATNNATASGATTNTTSTPGAGGPAGAAVTGNSNITWTNEGTRLGAVT